MASNLHVVYLPAFYDAYIDAEDEAADVDAEYVSNLILLPHTTMQWACDLDASDLHDANAVDLDPITRCQGR